MLEYGAQTVKPQYRSVSRMYSSPRTQCHSTEIIARHVLHSQLTPRTIMLYDGSDAKAEGGRCP